MPSQSTWKVNVPSPPTACLLIFSDPVLTGGWRIPQSDLLVMTPS